MALTDSQIRSLSGGKRVAYYGDMHGLRLRVIPTGGKSWTQRLTVQGKRVDRGLGGYPAVSLADARHQALLNKQEAQRGGDPFRTFVSFKQAAEAKMALDAPAVSAKTHAGNERLLEQYAYPALGSMRMGDVRTWHVMDILEPIWVSKHPTAKALLRLMSLVGRYSIAKGFCVSDPADPAIIGAALPKIARKDKAVKHQRAVEHGSVRDALAKVEASRAMAVSKALIRFTALTAARAGETRMARWQEFDLSAKVWTVPADRMKARREHRVPLSDQAVSLLESMGADAGSGSALVFRNGRGKAVGESTLRKLLRTLKLGSLHGFRASFRTWAAEARIDRDVAELSLAHVTANGNQTERAYNRSDLLEQRRDAMQRWADHIA